jgi:hypothetical protein
LVHQDGIHWKVAFFGYPSHNHPVEIFIIIKMILSYIEKAVRPEPEGLVNLEIKAD